MAKNVSISSLRARVHIFEDMLRDAEQAKIKCGREHFKALSTDAQYYPWLVTLIPSWIKLLQRLTRKKAR
jgi:hypothetical protein